MSERLPRGSAQCDPESLLGVALRHSDRGWRCFPAGRDRPLITRYHGDTAFDTETLKTMPWERAAFIGVAMPALVMALDVDVKNGKLGYLHLGMLEQELGYLDKKFHQRSKSGGQHLLQRIPLLLPGQSFASRVRLPGDGWADIDIIHRNNRYLRLYEFDWLPEDAADVPMLPQRWLDWLLRDKPETATRGGLGSQSASSAPNRLPVPWDVASAVSQVASCTDHRNDNLLKVAHRLAVCGKLDLDSRGLLVDAAVTSGLTVRESNKAIANAVRGAASAWDEVRPWLQSVLASDRCQGSRRISCRSVAVFLAMLSALCDSREVQVSVRLAAESLGCSSSTAHRYLQDLHSAGYITRELHSSIAEASIITLCRLTRWDKKTLPFFLSHPVSDELRLMWLLASPAFMTVGAVHGLSRALSGVLLDIPPEGISVNTLVSLRNRDADEVSRHLRMLRVEELISVQDGLVRIPAGTPEAAVAWWAQRHGRLRLSELRHISHDYERGAFRATNSIRQEAGLPELQDPAQRPRFR